MDKIKFLVCDLSLLDRPQYKNPADGFQSYEDLNNNYNWDSKIHPPISWHSYAACMNGRFCCAPEDNWAEHIKWADCILVLWNYNPKIAQQAIENMRKLGKKVIGAYHENYSFFQYSAQNLQWVVDFKNCANACNTILAYPQESISNFVYSGIGITVPIVHITQPYHLAEYRKMIIPPENRHGVFVGPQKKDQEIEHRNWLLNVAHACDLVLKNKVVSNKVTIINSSSMTNDILHDQLSKINPVINFNIVSRQSPYRQYLELLAQHEITVNDDSTGTQGQVNFDSYCLGVPVDITNLRTDFGDLYYDWNKITNGTVLDFVNEFCSLDTVRNKLYELYYKI